MVALTGAREEAAGRLTAARTTAAAALGARITDELSHLAMGSATVSVAVEDAGRFTTDGRDDIEIRLASGSGTAPRAVTKAASGGELSRVMLAIEVATATEVTSVPTFVFDEVDAGVGGRAALDVGARLAALARHAQVVVVTHLAQVAAHADRHLVVERSDDGHVTRSGVHEVEGEQRVAELAPDARRLRHRRRAGARPRPDGARPGLARRGTMVQMSIRLPARSNRGPRPGLSGPARVDRRTKDLTKRLRPGDIAVIDHEDLDRVSAEALVACRPAAVVNASTSISGRYPNLGPEILVAAGIPLLDDAGPDVMDAQGRHGARPRGRCGAHRGGDRRRRRRCSTTTPCRRP